MSATDELLTLLKEHGVERYEHEAPATDCIAFFDGRGWHDCWESTGGEVNVTFSMTPAQAIAVTLGSSKCSNNCTNSERTETCHIKPWKMERDTGFYDCMECECGYVSDVSDWAKRHFCPNCGARVVEPTTNDVDVEVDA